MSKSRYNLFDVQMNRETQHSFETSLNSNSHTPPQFNLGSFNSGLDFTQRNPFITPSFADTYTPPTLSFGSKMNFTSVSLGSSPTLHVLDLPKLNLLPLETKMNLTLSRSNVSIAFKSQPAQLGNFDIPLLTPYVNMELPTFSSINSLSSRDDRQEVPVNITVNSKVPTTNFWQAPSNYAICDHFDFKNKLPETGATPGVIPDNDLVGNIFQGIGNGIVGTFTGLKHIVTHPFDSLMAPLDLIVDGQLIRQDNQYKTAMFMAGRESQGSGVADFANQCMNQRFDTLGIMYDAFDGASGYKKINMLSELGASFITPGAILQSLKVLKPLVSKLSGEWMYFYRGDECLRAEFMSSLSQQKGSSYTQSYLAGLSEFELKANLNMHSVEDFINLVNSKNTPFISASSDPYVAFYYATNGLQREGYITTFRIKRKEAMRLVEREDLIPNVENPWAFERVNSETTLGRLEREYVFADKIDPRYVYKTVPASEFQFPNATSPTASLTDPSILVGAVNAGNNLSEHSIDDIIQSALQRNSLFRHGDDKNTNDRFMGITSTCSF